MQGIYLKRRLPSSLMAHNKAKTKYAILAEWLTSVEEDQTSASLTLWGWQNTIVRTVGLHPKSPLRLVNGAGHRFPDP